MPRTQLQRLFAEQGQSPWLDTISRRHLTDGTLARVVAHGIRGVTANPTILARAIQGGDDYDEQFLSLVGAGVPVVEAYWDMVLDDITAAAGVLRPVFESSGGADGFVSVEVAPELADDTSATIASARRLHERIHRPNVLVKVPATAAGVPAVEALTAEGRSINVTLVFSLARYAEIVDAYLSGLETLVGSGGDPSEVHSVASFFVGRVDAEVDRRLTVIGTPDAVALLGRAGVAQAKLAYRLFGDRFAGPRWNRLAGLGAHCQRLLWASTATKNPAYRDTLYVDSLIGPDTVNTMPESVVAAFEDHGIVARTLDTDVEQAADVMRRLAAVGVDMDDVGLVLEKEGVAAFHDSFQAVLAALAAKVPAGVVA